MNGLKKKIVSSWLLWCGGALFALSFILMLISIIGIPFGNSVADMGIAVVSGGITGEEAVKTYISLHIAVRIAVLICAGISGLGILITLISAAVKNNDHPTTFGISMMSGFQAIVNKLIKPFGAVLSVAFIFKLVMFIISCYEKRYQNSVVYLFFATVFGEAILAAIVVGLLRWLYNYSSACEDDLAIIQYCLIMNRQPTNSISATSRYSLFAFSVILGYLAAVFHYDAFALVSCALSAFGCLMLGIFLWRFIGICETLY